jgi:hypothetical protein
MPRSRDLPRIPNASTRPTRYPQFATHSPVSRATLARLAIGLVIVALIVIGLTNPSGAQTTGGVRAENAPSSLGDKATLFSLCLQDWDVGTHMTKQEWAGACQRLLLERGDYLRKPTR